MAKVQKHPKVHEREREIELKTAVKEVKESVLVNDVHLGITDQ